MNYLVVKVGDIFKFNGYYLYDPTAVDINEKIFSTLTDRYRKATYTKGCYYYKLKERSYPLKRLDKWYNEWVDLGKPNLDFTYIETKLCVNCNKELPVNYFTSVKSKYCSDCILGYINLVDFDDDYLVVDKFLKKMRAKKWMATTPDLFELVDAFDRYYPTKEMITTLNEDYAVRILRNVIKEHIKRKKDIIKKW